jgi:hypothetical protein
MPKIGSNSGGSAVSDRSGFRHPMSEMVIEPGTGWLVHRSESDGMWNEVDHPLNHVQKFVDYGDPFPIENARPEQTFELDYLAIDATGVEALTDENGSPLHITNNQNITLEAG